MNRTLLALIVAALTLFCAGNITISYLNHGRFPGGGDLGTLRPLDASRSALVTVNDAGRTLGLRPGDIRDLRLWTPEERVLLYYGYAWAGTAFDLPYVRGDEIVHVHAVAQLEGGRSFGDVLDVVMRIALIFAGILLIARGTDRASLYAGLFMCGNAVYEGFTNAYAGHAVAVGTGTVGNFVSGLCSYFGRFLFGYALLSARVPRALRFGAVALFVLIAVPFFASLFERSVLAPLFAFAPPALQTIPYFPLQFALGLAILITFAIAATFAEGAIAGAVRLIAVVLVLSYVGPAVNFIAAVSGQPYPMHGLLNVTYLLFAIGLPYAVLAKRLVAIDFVVSKTLVYTIVLTLIVGVFVLAERVIEQAALGRLQSYALELVVPLILGFSIQWIERWTEGAVERLLYRDRLRAEHALQALAEDFPHARNVGILADRVAAEIHRHMRAPFVCVYRETQTTYTPIALAGRGEALPVDADDPVFLRIRAKHRPVQTEEFATSLPSNGAVFPLVVFGKVTGALFCHYRESGERYDPDETETLRRLAHELAIALLWVERVDPAAAPALT